MPQYTPKRQPKQLPDGTIEIILTRGFVTIIDAIDSDLSLLTWRAICVDVTYAVGQKRGQNDTMILLHRLILERILNRSLDKTEIVDHVNGDGLDNRRSNLRLATHGQNMANSKMRSNNTSGFKGVSLDRQSGKWRAQIQHNKKRILLGCFDDPELAHKAYCEAAIKYHGEFANNGEE